MMLSNSQKGLSEERGSFSKASTPAPAMRFFFRVSSKASSSTMPPLEMMMRCDEGFISPRWRAVIIPWDSVVNGAAITIQSDISNISSSRSRPQTSRTSGGPGNGFLSTA